MAFSVRVSTVVVVVVMMMMIMAQMLQVSHAIVYKVGDSARRTTTSNLDHYNKWVASHTPIEAYGGFNDKMNRLHLSNAGNDHHQQVKVDTFSPRIPHIHKKTLFLTFSKKFPIPQEEVIAFFTQRFGAVEAYIQEVPSHAQIVFRHPYTASAVLRGKREAKLSIDGKDLRAKKYVPPKEPINESQPKSQP